MQCWPQSYGHYGFGCGFADLDGDGDLDVIVLGAADGHVGIFENLGNGYFLDRSSTSIIPPLPEGSGLAAGDYDGDDRIDLYLTQIGLPNLLMKNMGGFIFCDVTASAGVGNSAASESACFGDFDNDGCLDLYVCNYRNLTADNTSKLFRNKTDGTCEDVSQAQSVDDAGYGFQAVWFDYNRDGNLDLYLSNDKGFQSPYLPNQLWRNDSGVLTNISAESQADVALFSMGVACGDFDGNGWPDLYCTNIPGGGGMNNPLLLNDGAGHFRESGVAAGVDNPFISWGSIFFDFDNDGHLDLYVNNMFDLNALYHKSGTFPCIDVARNAGVSAGAGPSFSSAVADVDADGDLDLLVNDLGGNVQLFINHQGQNQNWIRYRIVGQGANRLAIGGHVRTCIDGAWHFDEVLAGGNGYKGQNETIIHVGLGTATQADTIIVSWTGGQITRTILDLSAGHTWTLYPPQRLGDADGNGTRDLRDFALLATCIDVPLEPGCEVMDLDSNTTVNLADYALFLDRFFSDLTP